MYESLGIITSSELKAFLYLISVSFYTKVGHYR